VKVRSFYRVVVLVLVALLLNACSSSSSSGASSINGNKAVCAALAAWTKGNEGVGSQPPHDVYVRESTLLMNRLTKYAPIAKSPSLSSEAERTAASIRAGNGKDTARGMNSMDFVCNKLGYHVSKMAGGA
jgi:hypothetical protein